MRTKTYTIPCLFYRSYQFAQYHKVSGTERQVMARETATLLIIEGATPGTERQFYKGTWREVGTCNKTAIEAAFCEPDYVS